MRSVSMVFMGAKGIGVLSRQHGLTITRGQAEVKGGGLPSLSCVAHLAECRATCRRHRKGVIAATKYEDAERE
jgi:hypothetical protein